MRSSATRSSTGSSTRSGTDTKPCLKQGTDAASRQAIQARLDLVARHEAAANSARNIEVGLGEEPQPRPQAGGSTSGASPPAETPQHRPYDAKGMIQPSSHKVDGQKVFALIGPQGTAVAYLNIPAGLDPSQLTARNVGVRGACATTSRSSQS